MITTRTGETLIVKTGNGNVTVVFTAGTTTKDDRGLFGLEPDHLSDVVLRTFLARSLGARGNRTARENSDDSTQFEQI